MPKSKRQREEVKPRLDTSAAQDGRYVQSCIAHVGFPSTLPELRRAYNAGDGWMEMELLLDTAKGHDRTWSSPRWMTVGDVMFFYHTKRARRRIETFLSAANGPDSAAWGAGDELQASIGFLADQLAVAEKYAGTIFGCTEVAGVAAFQKGDADRHWRNNIYAPIGDVHIFKHSLRDSEFRRHIKINPGGTFTPLHGSSFAGLKDLLAQNNQLPPYLQRARPGGVSFRDVDRSSWIDISCDKNARFIDESQLRAYLIDFFLEAIKDPQTAVHQECRCSVTDGHPSIADYFVKVGGNWIPVEAKLNVKAEQDLPGQISRYVCVTGFVPSRGPTKGRSIAGPCSSVCLVIDSAGIYLVTANGYLGCSPDRPLWCRSAIGTSLLTEIRRRLISACGE